MNLPKAIEILDLNINDAGKKMPADTLTALKLGREALIRVEHTRHEDPIFRIPPLQGETP